MGSGPSPPTKPLANSLTAVVDLTEVETGAKATAEPAIEAMIAAVNLAMLNSNLKTLIPTLNKIQFREPLPVSFNKII